MTRSSKIATPFVICLLCVFGGMPPVCFSADETRIDFDRQIRPILAANCFACHGPDEGAREADLRLDVPEAAAADGVIVPGKPEQSEFLARITSDDPELKMPPVDSDKKITPAQIELLRQWISQGATYQKHWAFVAPKRPSLPVVENSHWPRNPIDHFVLAKLEREGLKPSPAADRYTLTRRVYLDLIGLPPTPSEADAFVNDQRPDAYERVVDRLLDSPHYGERWARAWLDLARYSDTNGYEKDQPRTMWPYRDWVINALNADMPFDRFTVEQIAGDMLPNATPQQIIATGFHRNTMINEEGGIDPMEFRFYAQVDRVATTGTVWLGLTVGCAQCHTHKYDPIEHREFYRLMSFYDQADDLEYDVLDAETTKRREEIDDKIAAIEADLPNRYPLPREYAWTTPASIQATSLGGATLGLQEDRSLKASGTSPERDTYEITLDAIDAPIQALRLEALVDETLPNQGPGRAANGNFVVTDLSLTVSPPTPGAEATPIAIAAVEADFSQSDFPIEHAIDGDKKTGWAIAGKSGEQWNVDRTAIIHFKEPMQLDGGTRLTVTIEQNHGMQHTLGRFRLSVGQPRQYKRSSEERRRELLQRDFAAWQQQESEKAAEWSVLEPAKWTSTLPILTVLDDNSVLASGDYQKSETFEVGCRTDLRTITAIRLEALPHESLPNHGPGRGSISASVEQKGRFLLTDFSFSVDGQAIPLTNATESYAHQQSTAAKALDDDLQSGWANDGTQGKAISAVFQLQQPLQLTDQSLLTFMLHCEAFYPSGLGRFRLSVTSDSAPIVATGHAAEIEAILVKPAAERSEFERQQLFQRFLATAPKLATEHQRIEELRGSKPRYVRTLVTSQRNSNHYRQTRRHHRGEYLKVRESVEPGVFGALHNLPEDTANDRLALARWLIAPENPLTARVTMNRDWAAIFGRGIVGSLDDFGVQGQSPTHPELLDWLAVELVENGWSRKHMHRLMVNSATYRQSSRATSQLRKRDPGNLLLARGPRFRLDAELVRDSLLSISGVLSKKVGGPSVFPPQPPGITEGAYGRLTWTVSQGEDRFRRGLYTFNKRTAPYAMFTTFDGPSGELCVARRERSNTPLQALMLLNDEVVIEASRALATVAVNLSASDTTSRARELYRRCIIRPPEPEEIQAIVAFFERQTKRFQSGELNAAETIGEKGITDDKNAVELAAWTTVARVLLNLDETITKD